MNLRKASIGTTGVIAIVLATAALAWACGSPTVTDMKLENTHDVTWDSGADQGKNWSDCAVGRQVDNRCTRYVTVTGTNFVNDTAVTAVGSVELYWIDEPHFALLANRGHDGQKLTATACRAKGVRLTTNSSSATTATVNSSGGFTAEVVVPAKATTHNDGTARPVQTYSGANAICAVWNHDVLPAGTSTADHSAGIGNQYNIFP